MAKKKLSPEVAAKYTLQGVEPGRHHFNGFGVYDMCTLSLAEAEELVKQGFKWLQLKKNKPPKAPRNNAPS